MRRGIGGQALAIVKKDVLLEWRTRARLSALVFFSLTALLLFSFALGPDIATMRAHAGGYLWLGLLLASVLALSESFRVEAENRALEAVLLSPADARAVYIGKALANAAFLLLLGTILVPIMMALYDVTVDSVGKLFLVLALGAFAISAPGTLLSAISIHVKSRDVLLPLLLFPLLVPVLLSAVKATSLAITGDPMGDAATWLSLLGIFNLVYWSVGFLLFPAVVQE
jgi:heme exporter protein B